MNRISKRVSEFLSVGVVLCLLLSPLSWAMAQTCIEPPAGLVGWWPLDEVSGTTAADIVGGHDGTHVGGPTPVTGKVAGGLSFDGIDDAVRIPATFPFHQPGDTTLEFWLNTPAAGHHAVFWTRADSMDSNRFHFFVNADSTFGFDYRSPSGALHILVGQCCTGVPIPRNAWTHLAITRTGDVYSLYVNGTLAASAPDASPDLPTATDWHMSGRSGGMYQGNLDEVALYNRALSATEIAAIFNASSAGKCKSSASLFISPSSGNYVTTQRFDLTLILKSSGLSAVGGNAILDGTDVTAALGGCIKPGTLIAGGQTFRCPDIKIKDVLSPGSHTFSVTLDLSDGNSVSDTVTWEVLSNTEP